MPELNFIPDIPVAEGPASVQVFVISQEIHRVEAFNRAAYWHSLPVPPDFAGDLTNEPLVWICPVERVRGVEMAWQVGAAGFVEAEALDAFDQAVERLRSRWV